MSAPAPIRVLFFSLLREITGTAELAWQPGSDGPLAPTVADVWQSLTHRWPGLAAWEGKVLIAVDLTYADCTTPLRGGEELALMPPVQGG
jgi:molybdopterin converting factor small subunit